MGYMNKIIMGYANKITSNVISKFTDQCLSQPSSEKHLLQIGSDYHREPQLLTVQTAWDIEIFIPN